MTNNKIYDFLIIGSGLAGLFAAYHASKFGSVLIVSKIDKKKSNSWLAQGGIAAALSDDDSTESHIEDTLAAGRGICNVNAVKVLIEEGEICVKELISIGMEFDKKDGNYLFGLEGGHSRRRVLHAQGSSTGETVTKFLLNKIESISNINFHNRTQALSLIYEDDEVKGINTLNLNSDEQDSFYAKNTILATGGYNNIYFRNTNPKAAIGEGISMAISVGAEVRDMEFTQFHPTAFYSESGAIFLISEAVRGEGAYLINSNGDRFMSNYHEMEELAPRDIVAKAIFEEIKKSDNEYIFLDVRHLSKSLITKHFKNIYNFALENNIDITKQLIPIAPAAHYSIGGVKTDIFGATNIRRLFAIGEVASTCVHGANRLASNSLLECLVFGKRAILKASENLSVALSFQKIKNNKSVVVTSSMEHYQKVHRKIQIIFTEKVGIVRHEEELNNALNEIEIMTTKVPENTTDVYLRKEKNMLLLALTIVKSAIYRKESRGSHQRSNFPNLSNDFYGHVVLNNSVIKFEKKMKFNAEYIEKSKTTIKLALSEDIQKGDVTTLAVIDKDMKGIGKLVAKESGIIAGLNLFEYVFKLIDDKGIEFNPKHEDGAEVKKGQTIAEFSGLMRTVLSGERTALNFLQRMSGVATKTKEYVDLLEGTKAKLLDTRKTIPGLRYIDKYSVAVGGGENHRIGLFDMVLLKENHIKAYGSITSAVQVVREKYGFDYKIEVETRNIEEIKEVIKSNVDVIMLDNMSIKDMELAVKLINGSSKIEASGNITVRNIREVAETGVDYISVGAITHSVSALDISLLIV